MVTAVSEKLKGFNREQSGQSIVMVTIILFCLVCFLAFTINVSDRISRKIEIQNAADSAVMSGAVWHARGLNAISVLNIGMTESLALMVFFDSFEYAYNYIKRLYPISWAGAKAVGLIPFVGPFLKGLWQTALCVGQAFLGTGFYDGASATVPESNPFKTVVDSLQNVRTPLWSFMGFLGEFQGAIVAAVPAIADTEASTIAYMNGARSWLDTREEPVPARFVSGSSNNPSMRYPHSLLLPYLARLPVETGSFEEHICQNTLLGGKGVEQFLVPKHGWVPPGYINSANVGNSRYNRGDLPGGLGMALKFADLDNPIVMNDLFKKPLYLFSAILPPAAWFWSDVTGTRWPEQLSRSKVMRFLNFLGMAPSDSLFVNDAFNAICSNQPATLDFEINQNDCTNPEPCEGGEVWESTTVRYLPEDEAYQAVLNMPLSDPSICMERSRPREVWETLAQCPDDCTVDENCRRNCISHSENECQQYQCKQKVFYVDFRRRTRCTQTMTITRDDPPRPAGTVTPTPYVLEDSPTLTYNAITRTIGNDKLGLLRYGGSAFLDDYILGTATAEVYNKSQPTNPDLFNQDWRAKLVPTRLSDVELFRGVSIPDSAALDRVMNNVILH